MGYALMLHRTVCAHWGTVHVLDLTCWQAEAGGAQVVIASRETWGSGVATGSLDHVT